MKSQYLIVLLALVFGISKASAQTIVVKADSPSADYSSKLTNTLQFIELENGDGYSLSYGEDGQYKAIEKAVGSNKYYISELYKNTEEKPEDRTIKYRLTLDSSGEESFFTIQFTVPKADDLSKLPFPTFSQNDDSEFKSYRRNRHLIIDANPNPKARLNTQLLKYKKDTVKNSNTSNEEDEAGTNEENQSNGETNNPNVNGDNEDDDQNRAAADEDQQEKVVKEFLVKAHAIPKTGSIAVFIKNYNFWNIEKISISINEEDYTYNKGLIDIRNQVLTDDEDSSGADDKENAIEVKEGEDTNQDKTTQDPFEVYLKNVYTTWEDIKYLNFNDLGKVESYKDTLTKSINEHEKVLTPDQQTFYSKILSWYPEYVSLTDIPLSSVDADEVNFKLKIKNENETTETEYDLRTYRIVGGLSFNISSTLFLTRLVNGSVYTDSVEIEGVKELRAKIDDTSKKFTVGIGVNTEITYRSGWMVNPTASIGFFVPFDEDITPNIALGGGLSVITKRVRLSLTGGLAIGQVNAIEDRYVDRNLADFPNLINENLSTKRWDKGLQFGIGLSYKLKE